MELEEYLFPVFLRLKPDESGYKRFDHILERRALMGNLGLSQGFAQFSRRIFAGSVPSDLLNEANTLLSETQDSIKILTEKSNELFKIVVVITTALIGFIFTSPSSLIIQILTIYYILAFSFVIYKLYSVIYPKRNALMGTEPKNILVDQMIGENTALNEKRFVLHGFDAKP